MILWLAALACKQPVFEADGRVSESMNTIVWVDVTATFDADVRVAFGEDGAYDHTTPTQAMVTGQPASFQLLGMPSLADVTWQVLAGDEVVADGVTSTRNLPSDLPEFELIAENDHPDQHSAEPYVLLATTGGHPAVVMVNRDGRIVWYKQPTQGGIQWVQPYWSDGTALFNEFDAQHIQDIGMIRRVTNEDQPLEDIRATESHHTFTELPDGTLVYLRRDKRGWTDPATETDYAVIGDAIVERYPDGTEEVVFTAWDWLDVRVTPDFFQPFYRDGRDWTHANAIHYREDRDTYLVSFSNLDTLLEFDRATRAPLRWFGVDGTDPYRFTGARTLSAPHDPRWTGPDTFSVFMTDESLGRSGVVEYKINEETHQAEQIWSFAYAEGEPAHRAYFLGQAFGLENDNTLVKWAQTGRVVEATPEGDVVWDLRLASGAIFGEADVVRDIYGGGEE